MSDRLIILLSTLTISFKEIFKERDVMTSLFTFTLPDIMIFSASLLEQNPELDILFEILINSVNMKLSLIIFPKF